ncbi:hypothetical protein CCACVL1_14210, partial [Corchorus capsularis]
AEIHSLDFLCNSVSLKVDRCVSRTVQFMSISVGRLAKHAAALVMVVTILRCISVLKETAEVMALIFRFAMALTNAQVAARKKQH